MGICHEFSRGCKSGDLEGYGRKEIRTGHVASCPVCVFVERLLVMAGVGVGGKREEEDEEDGKESRCA